MGRKGDRGKGEGKQSRCQVKQGREPVRLCRLGLGAEDKEQHVGLRALGCREVLGGSSLLELGIRSAGDGYPCCTTRTAATMGVCTIVQYSRERRWRGSMGSIDQAIPWHKCRTSDST